MTFEQAQRALKLNTARYTSGRIGLDEWAAHVQFVIAALDDSRAVRAADSASLPAPTLPRKTDAAKPRAVQPAIVIPQGHAMHSDAVQLHGA